MPGTRHFRPAPPLWRRIAALLVSLAVLMMPLRSGWAVPSAANPGQPPAVLHGDHHAHHAGPMAAEPAPESAPASSMGHCQGGSCDDGGGCGDGHCGLCQVAVPSVPELPTLAMNHPLLTGITPPLQSVGPKRLDEPPRA